MSCSSCDALGTKGKTCWRHAPVEMHPSYGRGFDSLHVDVVLNANHPAHRGHQKTHVPCLLKAGYDFLCSCGLTLHLTTMAMHTSPTPGSP